MKKILSLSLFILTVSSILTAQPAIPSPESSASVSAADESTPAAEEQQDDEPASGPAGSTELKGVVDALKKLKITGYIQAQYVEHESSEDELTSGGGTKNKDQFSVRRGRAKFVYQAAPTARFTLQLDASNSGVALRDAYVELSEPWTSWKHTLAAGQFKWPFGFEILQSSGDREMPERTRVIRALFPGERDRGVSVSGKGVGGRFSYALAVMNGSGTAGSSDPNSAKDLIGRVSLSAGPLGAGLSAYRGTDLVATSAVPAGVEYDKDRDGIDVQWITPVPGLGVRAEYIQGEERGKDVDGWYAALIQNLGARHQLVVRLDEYDPNNDASNDATRTTGAAYIYHFDKNIKVTLARELQRLEEDDPDDDITTVRLQYKF